MSCQEDVSHVRMVVSLATLLSYLPLMNCYHSIFSLALSFSIYHQIYVLGSSWLAVCNCLSFTLRSGDLPSLLMAIFKKVILSSGKYVGSNSPIIVQISW